MDQRAIPLQPGDPVTFTDHAGVAHDATVTKAYGWDPDAGQLYYIKTASGVAVGTNELALAPRELQKTERAEVTEFTTFCFCPTPRLNKRNYCTRCKTQWS